MTLATTMRTPTIRELPGIILPRRDWTIEQRIRDGGYKFYASAISSLFSLSLRAGLCPLVLVEDVHPREELLGWAADQCLETAPLDGLLAVGAHYDHGKLQEQFPIVCLQASSDGRLPYLYIDRACGGRCLHLAPPHEKLADVSYVLLRRIENFSAGTFLPCE